MRAQWLLNKWINKREIAVEFAYMHACMKVMFRVIRAAGLRLSLESSFLLRGPCEEGIH